MAKKIPEKFSPYRVDNAGAHIAAEAEALCKMVLDGSYQDEKVFRDTVLYHLDEVERLVKKYKRDLFGAENIHYTPEQKDNEDSKDG